MCNDSNPCATWHFHPSRKFLPAPLRLVSSQLWTPANRSTSVTIVLPFLEFLINGIIYSAQCSWISSVCVCMHVCVCMKDSCSCCLVVFVTCMAGLISSSDREHLRSFQLWTVMKTVHRCRFQNIWDTVGETYTLSRYLMVLKGAPFCLLE